MKPFLKIHSCEMPTSTGIANPDDCVIHKTDSKSGWCMSKYTRSEGSSSLSVDIVVSNISTCPFCGQPLDEPQTEQGGVKEVKRPAKVGEWVKIISADRTDGCYKNGDILKVISVRDYGIDADTKKQHVCNMFNNRRGSYIDNHEYVVLDGYKPEPAPTSHTTVNNITIDAKCTAYRRERINEAICTPKLDTKGIYAELERILKMVGI